MKKIIVTIILCSAICSKTHAQKSNLNIAVGSLLSVPTQHNSFPSNLKIGGGLLAIGQYNFSNRSAVLLQSAFAMYGNRDLFNYDGQNTVKIFSLHTGYKYDVATSGYFINGLAGVDDYSEYGTSFSFAIGAGKRFTLRSNRFIDAGIDYVFGDTDQRFNLKITFIILQRFKEK